jgi:RNA polymerase sigma-70 factor (ECF subfamily)
MSSTMTFPESPAETADRKLAAFLEVAQRQRGKLLQLVEYTTSYSQEAEDIVQEALLKAFRALPGFRGDSQMETWLHTIVRNATLEFARNRKRRVETFAEQPQRDDGSNPADEFPDPGESPEDYCERKELENALRVGMEEVSPLCRLALQMCVFQDMPYSEAASDLHISIPALKSRLFQSRRKLKRAVQMRLGH